MQREVAYLLFLESGGKKVKSFLNIFGVLEAQKNQILLQTLEEEILDTEKNSFDRFDDIFCANNRISNYFRLFLKFNRLMAWKKNGTTLHTEGITDDVF